MNNFIRTLNQRLVRLTCLVNCFDALNDVQIDQDLLDEKR